MLRSKTTKILSAIVLGGCLGGISAAEMAEKQEFGNMDSIQKNYREMLEKWYLSLGGTLYFTPGRPEVGSAGPGDHGHWAMQTHTTTFAALAVLATDPGLDEKKVGMSREQLRAMALRLLRFTLRTHVSGPEKTFDGESWGLSWISPLCIERMMHGVEALDQYLTPEDRQQLRNMLIAESDWHADKNPVLGAIDGASGKNKPESNIWSACLLFRTALMYPDAPRAKKYLEKANRFILNGISIPADAQSDQVIAGKPLKDWHVGPNFTANYGLNHHGYLNVGYMVICLSNIAMFHFSCREKGITPPEALYHHVPELWRLIRLCTFDDGRLWRIGGDTRVRYSYCQDYALPMWLLMRDKYGEDTTAMEAGWQQLVMKEQAGNADGSFLGGRLRELEEVSPLYYHRLEGDRAVTASMAAYWRRKYPNLNSPAKTTTLPTLGGWRDAFHGALLERGVKRAASWSWSAAQRPMGMCLPSDSSNMAEWRWNLVGEFSGMGFYNYPVVKEHRDAKFSGGFRTAGRLEWMSEHYVAEGQQPEVIAKQDIAAFALPDDSTMVVFQRANTVNRTMLRQMKGVFCQIPNDVFNDYVRQYDFGGQAHTVKGMAAKAETLPVGNNIAVDGKMNVAMVYGGDLSLFRPARRQIELVKGGNMVAGRSGGNLYCDEICSPCVTARQDFPAGTLLFDLAFTVRVGDRRVVLAEKVETGSEHVRAAKVAAADGKKYLLAVNFGKDPADCAFKLPGVAAVKMAPLDTLMLPLE